MVPEDTHRWISTDLTQARCGASRPTPYASDRIPTAQERAQRRKDRQGEPTCLECSNLIAADTARFNAEHAEFLSEMGPFLR